MKIIQNFKDFQVVYVFAAGMFTLGIASTQVMTKAAHAEDIKTINETILQEVKNRHQEQERLRNEIELNAVNDKINRLLGKDELTREQQGELRFLEKKQDKLLNAIHGS